MKTRTRHELRDEGSSVAVHSHWELAEKVAQSATLSRATQLRAILLFVVRRSLESDNQPIHESEIAHHALGRRIDFNPLDDNIVRVQMAHLRKKLDLYFSTEGKDEEVVITIALGSYLPVFSSRSRSAPGLQPIPADEIARTDILGSEVATVDAGQGSEVALVAERYDPGRELLLVTPRRRWMSAWTILAGIVILALAGSCLSLWLQNRAQQRSFYPWRYQPAVASFWSEILDSNRETDVVMSDAFFKLVQDIDKRPLTLDDYLNRSYIHQVLAEEKSPELHEVLAKVASWTSANPNHLILARRILALDPLGKKIDLYYARNYRPELIERDNVILLGSRLTNPWVDLFDSRLNFDVRPDVNDLTPIVNRVPAPGEEQVYTRSSTVGYCVVAYLPSPSNNDGKVILIEGTSVEATQAGGDFLLSEDRLSNFQKRLQVTRFPYFEVLLKTSQVKGTPFTATVEAFRTYPNLH